MFGKEPYFNPSSQQNANRGPFKHTAVNVSMNLSFPDKLYQVSFP
jgi:hypothetical protein